jgi:hypothetical protein
MCDLDGDGGDLDGDGGDLDLDGGDLDLDGDGDGGDLLDGDRDRDGGDLLDGDRDGGDLLDGDGELDCEGGEPPTPCLRGRHVRRHSVHRRVDLGSGWRTTTQIAALYDVAGTTAVGSHH